MENYREKLLSFVRIKGPVLPVDVSKFLNTNTIFAGAILSELVSNKYLLVSNTKKGGSPFYYIKGQEHRLQEISINLSGKEKEAYDLIKDKKVIRDKDALPWQRVALRTIKDFAVPIEVQFEDNTELFWKWHMLSEQETSSLVKNILETLLPKQQITTQATQINQTLVEDVKEKIVPIEKHSEKPIVERKEVKPRRIKKESVTNFETELQIYLDRSGIKFIEKILKKSGKELEGIVEVPSNIGNLYFYFKAKDKNSINENDLALAYASGKQKNLQTIFLGTGNLTKKAIEHLNKNLKGQVIFVSLNNQL